MGFWSSTLDLVARAIGANAQDAADFAQADIDAHVTDTANPHGVTAAQAGAISAAVLPSIMRQADTNPTLTSADDLDNVMTVGWYNWANQNPINNPAGLSYALLKVDKDLSQLVQIIYVTLPNTRIFVRRRNSGVWAAWYEIPSTANANTWTLAQTFQGAALHTGTAGIGYGAGAGGTVAQATSKGTPVTLNKLTGLISMNNAALAAGASITFTVNNSLVSATDFIVAHRQTGGTGGCYQIFVDYVAAGLFNITVKNIGATSLSESPVIRFGVFKGVSA